jgi:type I restriction enzyme S subunit
VNNHAHILRGKPDLADDTFLLACLNNADIQPYVTGAAQPKLSQANLRLIEVPIPPLPVQHRIASILSAYDELIENNQRRIKILEEMARSLYREWFVHFRFPGHDKVKMVPSSLGPIPQGWAVKKLTDLTAFLSRGISPKYDDEGDSIVINQKCIRDQRLSLDQSRRQTKPIPPDKCVRFGDVLINSTGVGTLGRVAQVYEDMERCTVDSHVSIVRPNADTDVDFFGCMLLLKQETFERLGVGATGQTELGRTAIGEVEIPVPPASLLKRFGALIRPTRTAVVTLTKQCENLRRTRDLLLPRLLSGMIAV